MTYRIQIVDAARGPLLVFMGLLDRAALITVEAHVRTLGARFGVERIDILLSEGTEIDPECAAPISRMPGATVRAASPFLERWLAGIRREES